MGLTEKVLERGARKCKVVRINNLKYKKERVHSRARPRSRPKTKKREGNNRNTNSNIATNTSPKTMQNLCKQWQLIME